MERLVSPSSSESLMSQSLESFEADSSLPMDTPDRLSSATPLNETHTAPLETVTNEASRSKSGIIVDTPSMDDADLLDQSVDNELEVYEEDDDVDEEIITPFPKRKRASTFKADELILARARSQPNGDRPVKRQRAPKQPKLQQQRGVIIGVWRDSDQPEDAEKHVINAFIDNHDRLRTRVYGANRRGEELIGNIPTGAGGCWVTAPKVIFDSHLIGLSTAEVKEYVRIRSANVTEDIPEERNEADLKAVFEAKAVVAAQDGQPSVSKTMVHRQNSNRTALPNQSPVPSHTPGFKAINAGQTPKGSPVTDGRINGVLLGYWADSEQLRAEDKHAVYGVLGSSDTFRVKVQRVSRDGRPLEGNFPTGAGGIWIHYDKVVLEPQLVGMNRHEIKEYVRIRQRDLEGLETEIERRSNEQKAIRQAKEATTKGHNHKIEYNRPTPELEVRQSARSDQKPTPTQQAEYEAVAEGNRLEKLGVRERQNEKTRKEVAIAGADIQETAHAELKHNLKKLNKVWVAQQVATGPGGLPTSIPTAYLGSIPRAVVGQEIKYHNGIKYERKQTGPFQGKLVSTAQLLNIDGEDYVEYRVLTQPSF